MGNKIIIAGKSIGLFGMETALSQVKPLVARHELTVRQGAEKIVDLLKKKNYIPPSAIEDYVNAFERLLEGEEDSTGAKAIRILGPGCVGCNKLEQLVMEVLAEQGIAADIYHVTDRDEIWRYGVTRTPALILGDEVLCAGPIPTKAQVQAWLSERL